MLSDVVALILASEGCCTIDELGEALSRSLVSAHPTHDALLAVLGDGDLFEPCAVGSEAWSLTDHCPHRSHAIPADASLDLEGFPSMFGWQREALEAWHAAGSRGLIEAVTGAGKSLVALHAIREIVAQGGRALVVVPTIELEGQWLFQLQAAFAGQHVVAALRDRTRRIYSEPEIVVSVMNSARDANFAVRHGADLLVVDEVHRCATPANIRILDERFGYRLGISATIARPDSGHLRYLVPYFGPVIYRYSHDMAVRDEVVAPFRLSLVPVTMSDDERTIYDDISGVIGGLIRAFMAQFGRPIPRDDFLPILIKATGGAYSTRSPGIEDTALKLQQTLFQRRSFLDGLSSKFAVLGQLATLIHEARRCLVFSQSIASAEIAASTLLQHRVRAAFLHSGVGNVLRREQLERFGRGEVEALVAPRLLDEGIDIPEVGLAIIVTASGSERQLIQRLGRILRRKPDGGVAQLVVLYARGTVEDPACGALGQLLPRLMAAAKSVDVVTPWTLTKHDRKPRL